MAFDKSLDNAVENMNIDINNDSIQNKIDSWASLFWYFLVNLWKSIFAMIFSFLILFKVIRFLGGNDSKSRNAVFITLLIMTGLQVLVFGIPFQGTYHLIKFVIEVVKQL